MANFGAHSRAGFVAATAAGIAVWWGTDRAMGEVGLEIGPLPPVLAGTAFLMAYLGAVFPDIDSPQTIPHRTVVRTVQTILLAALMAAAIYYNDRVGEIHADAVEAAPPATPAPEVTVVVAGFLAIAVVLGSISPLLDVVTGSHRTWTHDLKCVAGFAMLLGLGLFGLVLVSPLAVEPPVAGLASAVTGSSFYFGAMVHVGILDQ